MTWRDVLQLDTPDPVTARLTAALDKAEPWLPMGRITGTPSLPVTVHWYTPPTFENWAGQSDTYDIRLNASNLTIDGGWWEQTFLHECIHVLDKRCLNNTDRARVMAVLAGPTPTWGSGPYTYQCQELFAETASRHIWFTLIQKATGADLPAYGPYTFDPAVALPVMLDVLAGPTQQPLQQEDPAMLVKSWIYGEGADLLAAMSAARAKSAAVVTNRAEAAALIKAGATITVIGGPAAAALGLTWAVTGKAVTKGKVTVCVGSDYAQSITLAMAA